MGTIIQRLTTVAALLLGLSLAGCSDDDATSTATTELSTPTVESSTTTSESGGPITLAKAEDLDIGEFGEPTGTDKRLRIDAVEEDGEVTGEFRVNNVVVSLQCAGTIKLTGPETFSHDPDWEGWRDLILGGVVTEDPDGRGLVADVGDATVAVGDLLALIIRKDDLGYRVTLYADDSAASCTELVESVNVNLDGGFFDHVDDIETG